MHPARARVLRRPEMTEAPLRSGDDPDAVWERYMVHRGRFKRYKGRQLQRTFLTHLGLLLTVWILGGFIFSAAENWSVGDGLFFTAITLSTIGYGTLHPATTGTKLLLIVYAVGGLGLLAILLSSAIQLYSYRQRMKRKRKARAAPEPTSEGGLKGFWRRLPNVVVTLAPPTALLCIVLLLGFIFFAAHDTHWTAVNALYFVSVTLTTVGYGDVVPDTKGGITGLCIFVFACEVAKLWLVCAISFLGNSVEQQNPEAMEGGEDAQYDTFEGGHPPGSEAAVPTVPSDHVDSEEEEGWKSFVVRLWEDDTYREVFIAGLGAIGLCLVVGAALTASDNMDAWAAFYYVMTTITTIGYTDEHAIQDWEKVMVAFFSLVCLMAKFYFLYLVQVVATQRSLRSHTGPTWIDDMAAPNCMGCNQLFTVVRRRHHCRHCGLVFCDPCSQWRLPIPKFGYRAFPVRVCEGCHHQLHQEQLRAKASLGRVVRLLTLMRRNLAASAVLSLVIFLVGAGLFAAVEGWDYVTGMYFTAVVLLTIGFGDVRLQSSVGRFILLVYAITGLGLFSYVVTAIQEWSSMALHRALRKKRDEILPLVAQAAPPALGVKRGAAVDGEEEEGGRGRITFSRTVD